ncbi:MAG: hypothetical protein K2F81_00430 [Ruminococcus sp.]|nr:hypothetical protein [Ruminococcus sp.]
MKKSTKKLIAPIVIVTILCLYYLGIGIFFLCIDGASLIVRLLAVIIPSVLTAVSLAVLFQRIIEIRKGEEDDLSKY